MVRAPDPLRLHTASLVGAGFRTAVRPEADALVELRTIAGRHPDLAAQAAANAADLWTRRADGGLVDVDRAKTAAERLRQLAVDEDGLPVTPKREASMGGHQIPNLPPG